METKKTSVLTGRTETSNNVPVWRCNTYLFSRTESVPREAQIPLWTEQNLVLFNQVQTSSHENFQRYTTF